MYDYVIAGGGTAGCVLAARLSEMADAKVLLIEAGPRDRDPYIHMPVGFFKMTSGPLTWGFETAPARHANRRRMVYPQARVLGGGSSINAEIYTRGCPEDYDGWARVTAAPAGPMTTSSPISSSRRTITACPGHCTASAGRWAFRISISPSPLSLAFVQGCMDIGMPYNPDFNSGQQEGCALYQTTIRNGRRCSTASASSSPPRRGPISP